MYHNLKKLLSIGFASFFMAACSTTSTEEITPETVSGRWILQMINTNVEFSEEDPENSTENVADQGLYFEFNTDGTYTTNGAIELGDISNGDGAISSGKYEFTNGVLALTYNDPDLGIPVTLYLNSDINGETMNLSLTKKELIDAFGDTTGLDAFTQAFLQIFLDQIVTFDFSLSLLKQ